MKSLQAETKVTANKMAEENQVQQEPQQVTTKEPQQVTTKESQRVTMKDLKKVEAGKRLAAHNRKKGELKAQSEAKSEGVNQYYGIGAVIALGDLGYYIYQTKQLSHTQSNNPPHCPPKQPSPCPQSNKFVMDKISSVL